MSVIQSFAFLAILLLVTVRTLAFRKMVDQIPPLSTAWAIGVGTSCICLLMLPVALATHLASFGSLLSVTGILAGLAKGVLLTLLLTVQQQIIGRSLSATAYVFPLAVGGIALLDYGMFGAQWSVGGLASIAILFAGGVLFSSFGELSAMPREDTGRFLIMVLAVVGFGLCDKLGIPSAGWYTYLLYTGIGNWLSARILLTQKPAISHTHWITLALAWTVPELFFNFALSGILPLSYGYFAISLRVPLLMAIAHFFYGEGHARSQIFFGLLSLIGTAPLFFA